MGLGGRGGLSEVTILGGSAVFGGSRRDAGTVKYSGLSIVIVKDVR